MAGRAALGGDSMVTIVLKGKFETKEGETPFTIHLLVLPENDLWSLLLYRSPMRSGFH